jgi:hypothetical protein
MVEAILDGRQPEVVTLPTLLGVRGAVRWGSSKIVLNRGMH